MPSIERFEDIEAWKRAREATKKIYQLSSSGDFSRDFGLKDQIRRSSVSVMSNIAEGFERDGYECAGSGKSPWMGSSTGEVNCAIALTEPRFLGPEVSDTGVVLYLINRYDSVIKCHHSGEGINRESRRH